MESHHPQFSTWKGNPPLSQCLPVQKKNSVLFCVHKLHLLLKNLLGAYRQIKVDRLLHMHSFRKAILVNQAYALFNPSQKTRFPPKPNLPSQKCFPTNCYRQIVCRIKYCRVSRMKYALYFIPKVITLPIFCH